MNKRSLVILFSLVSVVASYFAFAALPVSADANTEQCYESVFIYRNDTSSPGTVDLTLNDVSPQTHFYKVTVTLQPGETKNVVIHGLFPIAAHSFQSVATSVAMTFVDFGNIGRISFDICASFGKIGDGRINDGADQEGAPLAAYCTNDGGIAVWDIDATGQGTLGFSATKADITKALSDAQSSGQNVLVGQGLGDSLFALSSNQLTLVGPDVKEPSKMYEFITTPDVCG